MAVRGCYELFLVANLCNYVLNNVLVWKRPGMAVKPGSLSEPMNCDFLGIVTEGFTILETVFSKYIFV